MYTVALCDDQEISVDSLLTTLHSILEEWAFPYDIHCFNSGAAFLDVFQDDPGRFDILFLDVSIPGFNEIEFAQKIRRIHHQPTLVFFAATAGPLHGTARLRSVQYVSFPFNKEELRAVLSYDYHDNYLYRKDHINITLRHGQTFYRFPARDIFYLETKGRKVAIVTRRETLLLPGRLKEYESTLNNQFIRCHNSFIINIMNIKELNRTRAVTNGNHVIPISRTYRTLVQNAFLHLV